MVIYWTPRALGNTGLSIGPHDSLVMRSLIKCLTKARGYAYAKIEYVSVPGTYASFEKKNMHMIRFVRKPEFA